MGEKKESYIEAKINDRNRLLFFSERTYEMLMDIDEQSLADDDIKYIKYNAEKIISHIKEHYGE